VRIDPHLYLFFKNFSQKTLYTISKVVSLSTAQSVLLENDTMTTLNTYELVPIESLKPYSGNPRRHSPKQVRQVAKSIEHFGWINPILVDEDNQVLAGHGRLLAAQHLGLTKVPIIQVTHLSIAEKHAYRLADNKLAENATWDEGLVRVELEILMDSEIDFDMDLTGFNTPEIDMYLTTSEVTDDEGGDSEPLPNPPSPDQTVSRNGDVWLLGEHRLTCGDCRDPAILSALMQGQLAEMAITDPPYNVPIKGHVSGLGVHQHSEFAMASSEMSAEDFTEFLREALSHMASVSNDGSLHYVFMDWRHIEELTAAGSAVYDSLKHLCVWVKSNGGMGSFYRSQHELVFVFKCGKGAHINNIDLGRYGRYRTNVWAYTGCNAFGPDRDKALAMHPTVKPTPMIADAILDASRPSGIVLDVFIGSGTTLIAAEQTRRRCFGIEIDPRYVDVAIQRWRNLTLQPAVHESSGLTFEERTALLSNNTLEANHEQ
jgi:DNA modification methylase